MADKKTITAGQLLKGNFVIVDDVACRVNDVQISRPGKHGHAKIRFDCTGLIDGKKRIEVMPGHANIDVPIIEKKTAQILSVAGDMATAMDTESFETFELKIPDEMKEEIKEGVSVLYWIILDQKVMKQLKGE